MQRGRDMTLDEFHELMTTPCTEREARQSCTDFAIRRAGDVSGAAGAVPRRSVP
jgi:hypothetical protein